MEVYSFLKKRIEGGAVLGERKREEETRKSGGRKNCVWDVDGMSFKIKQLKRQKPKEMRNIPWSYGKYGRLGCFDSRAPDS